MKNIEGFTLSEVMITLGVVGVLAAILIPATTAVTPDTSAILFKKAYFTTEKVVNTMISDDSIYPVSATPVTNGTTGQPVPPGFNNKDTTNMGVPGGNNKFCYLFSERLNTMGAVNCTAALVGTTPAYTFTTADGIVWTFSDSDFIVNNDGYKTANVLSVDVNGAKAPNYIYAEDEFESLNNADQFRFRIRYDGKMSIDSSDKRGLAILADQTNNKKK